MKKFTLNFALFSSTLYVSFQLFANVLSTKIALIPIVNLAVDGGTIIYPLTFTLRDFVHKTVGKKNARQVVVLAALLNLVMFGLFWLIGKAPSDPSWHYQEAYNLILLPVGRIVVASVISQLVSELIDTEIFSIVYKKINDVAAVFISNTVSLLFDSLLFSFIAFFGNLPLATVLQIVVSNILIKLVMSTLSTPSIKWIPRAVTFEEM